MSTTSETNVVIPNSAANPRLSETHRRAIFVDRQERILQGTGGLFDAFAVEAWFLNEQSTQLIRRFAWEQSEHITLDSAPRTLATSDTDLVALAGGAVVLEKPEEVLEWPVPRRAASTICLPIASDTEIHGTLWIYLDRQREFTDQELEIVEIVAGRLAVEVERDQLLRSNTNTSNNNSVRSSDTENQINELQISTWSNPESDSEDLWLQLSSGDTLALSISILESDSYSEDQAVDAITQINETVHKLAQKHTDAGVLLTEANPELFESLPNGMGVSISIALLNGEGEGTFAMAGPGLTLRVRAATTSTIASESTPLGWDIDATYMSNPLSLNVNERLLLISGTPQLTNPILERVLGDQFRALTAEAHRGMSATNCIEKLLHAGKEELTAVAAVRRV